MFSVLHTLWPNDVCDVALPCGFARPWWQVHLRESVPLVEGKHAGANVVTRAATHTFTVKLRVGLCKDRLRDVFGSEVVRLTPRDGKSHD